MKLSRPRCRRLRIAQSAAHAEIRRQTIVASFEMLDIHLMSFGQARVLNRIFQIRPSTESTEYLAKQTQTNLNVLGNCTATPYGVFKRAWGKRVQKHHKWQSIWIWLKLHIRLHVHHCYFRFIYVWNSESLYHSLRLLKDHINLHLKPILLYARIRHWLSFWSG